MASDPSPIDRGTANPDVLDAPAPARERLARLESYLQGDPDNSLLRIDAFETALRCGQWSNAQLHLRHGQTLPTEALSWALKEGDFWLAQGRYDQARAVLSPLQALPQAPDGFAGVVLHNLAYIDFHQGQYSACVDQLTPYLESMVVARQPLQTDHPVGGPMAPADRALQCLWLRALHRVSDLERACHWTQQAEQQQYLDEQAAGIASLIAIDQSDFKRARHWVQRCLQTFSGVPMSESAPIEAYVTQASLALAEQHSQSAIEWADRALQLNPQDGRAWSARAFALLLAGQMELALRDFATALRGMPEHIGTWHGQAWTQLLLRDLDAAQASFFTSLALDRNFAESHGGLAVVLAFKKQTYEAQQHIARALGLDKRNLSGRYAQAILDGEVADGVALRRLAQRLLAGRSAPLGGDMANLLAKSAGPQP